MEAIFARHQRDLEFSTTLNLQPDDGDRFQMVYTTQLYGTFFVLYARFEVSESQSTDHIQLDNIEFLGVNYKGPICLEIENITATIESIPANSSDSNYSDYDREVGSYDAIDMDDPEYDNEPESEAEAEEVGEETTETEEVEMKHILYVELTLSGRGTGTFTRPSEKVLPVNLQVPKDATFRLERKLQSLSRFEDNESLNLPEDAFWNGIFDSEFFVRDGFFVKAKYGGMQVEFNEDTDLQDYKTGAMLDYDLPFALGINCPIGVGEINSGD